uniref:Uncharacterized protein n=1 Tax=Romanomermis culicivorax TaxID=13658 RepID=A0A915L145_ROMCU
MQNFFPQMWKSFTPVTRIIRVESEKRNPVRYPPVSVHFIRLEIKIYRRWAPN